jgi:hypothetical protein
MQALERREEEKPGLVGQQGRPAAEQKPAAAGSAGAL